MAGRHIFLVGFMGSGKSTFGQLLASRLSLPFVDLDAVIELDTGKAICELFDTSGESAFRLLEKQMLHQIASGPSSVVSTGGGTPCFFDNMDFMNQQGETIYLKTAVPELKARLERSSSKRPLLAGKSGSSLERFITETLEVREPYYLKATVVLPTDNKSFTDLMDDYLHLKQL
jgi:shikimate kinase